MRSAEVVGPSLLALLACGEVGEQFDCILDVPPDQDVGPLDGLDARSSPQEMASGETPTTAD